MSCKQKTMCTPDGETKVLVTNPGSTDPDNPPAGYVNGVPYTGDLNELIDCPGPAPTSLTDNEDGTAQYVGVDADGQPVDCPVSTEKIDQNCDADDGTVTIDVTDLKSGDVEQVKWYPLLRTGGINHGTIQIDEAAIAAGGDNRIFRASGDFTIKSCANVTAVMHVTNSYRYGDENVDQVFTDPHLIRWEDDILLDGVSLGAIGGGNGFSTHPTIPGNAEQNFAGMISLGPLSPGTHTIEWFVEVNGVTGTETLSMTSSRILIQWVEMVCC